jgi:hypothetical protein
LPAKNVLRAVLARVALFPLLKREIEPLVPNRLFAVSEFSLLTLQRFNASQGLLLRHVTLLHLGRDNHEYAFDESVETPEPQHNHERKELN